MKWSCPGINMREWQQMEYSRCPGAEVDWWQRSGRQCSRRTLYVSWQLHYIIHQAGFVWQSLENGHVTSTIIRAVNIFRRARVLNHRYFKTFLDIRIGASKVLGMQRILPNFSKLARKNSKENDHQKKDYISSHVGRILFNQSTLQAPFLPKFPLTCLKRTKQQNAFKKTFALLFWVPFL